jgi:N-methylhydantoinase A
MFVEAIVILFSGIGNADFRRLSTMSSRPFVIGADIGGTFTDVVVIEADGRVSIAKGISTPDAYERGIFNILYQLLAELGLAPADCTAVVHGTTVATNAIIERRGARTGLITTKGFRDVLELRRIRIPRLYDLTWEKPEPLVERYLRREVVERITHDGCVYIPLDHASVIAALADLQKQKVESVAVCLLNAYANPAHEQEVGRILRAQAPALDITLSAEILPEMREYERTSTAVINAYIMPVMRRYVASLTSGLGDAGFTVPLLLMQSNGGVMAGELACETPIHVIESGPAAGVIAAQRLAQQADIPNAVSLDIGGTTAKASLIEDGNVTYAGEYEVGASFTRAGHRDRGGGYALRSPTIDISEIGAGGGSIVWIDSGGALQVGPRSAGAMPGPVCYSLGGSEPTLTDACLLLGYLDKQGLAGGALPLDHGAAEAALAPLARCLDMGVVELAYGTFLIAVSNMTRAIRSVSTERGKDQRDYELIAFGGNGGIFAAAVARELELPRVVIPPAAGIFSAFGLLYSELEHHFTRTLLFRIDKLDPNKAESSWQTLEDEARQTLGREGFFGSDCQLTRMAELRYLSQTHELLVPWPEDATGDEVLRRLAARFEDAHEQRYGHRGHDGIVELVNLHLVGRGLSAAPRVPKQLNFRPRASRSASTRPAWFGDAMTWRDTRIISRDALAGEWQAGPVIIAEFDTTIVVPPDFFACRDRRSNVVMSRKS